MAESNLAKNKRSVNVPVKVQQTKRPTVVAAPVSPTPPPPKKKIPSLPKISSPVPARDWSEAQRRKMMWWMVGGVMVVVLIGWFAFFDKEFAHHGPNTLVSEITNAFRRLGGQKAEPDPAEQEIRKLDQQVFPQFQQ